MPIEKSKPARAGAFRINNPKLWISLVLGALLFVFLLRQVPLSDLAKGLGAVSIPLFVATLPFRVASNVFRTLRFAWFFPAEGKSIRLFGTFALIRVVNYVVPFRLGEAVSVILLKKSGFSPSVAETAPVWIFFRICDFIGLLLIAIAVSLAAALPVDIDHYVQIITVVLIATLALVVLVIPVAIRHLKNQHWPESSDRPWLRSRIAALRTGLTRIRSVRAFAVAQTSAVLIWISNIAGSVLALFAFSVPLSMADAVLVATLVTVIGLLPLRPPLGIGLTDTVWAALLVAFGIPLEQAIVISIGVRLAVMAAVLLDGAMSAMILLRPAAEHQGKDKQ